MATVQSLATTETINGKRYYNIAEGKKYPSVTTILGAMTDKSGIDKWRKRIGEEKADAISKFSANRGTVMHQFCEYFLRLSRHRLQRFVQIWERGALHGHIRCLMWLAL